MVEFQASLRESAHEKGKVVRNQTQRSIGF
jgi:hypothetical protein